MEYYNSVRILVSFEGFKKFAEQVELAWFDLDVVQSSRKRGTVYFGWDEITWFDDRSEPYDVIISALRFINERGYSYRLTRIGENFDDIEEIVLDGKMDGELEYIPIVRKFDDGAFM